MSDATHATSSDLSALRRSLRRVQGGHAGAVRDILDELANVTDYLEDEILRKIHVAFLAPKQLEELVDQVNTLPDLQGQDLDWLVSQGDARTLFWRQWAASTIIAYGPPEYRKKIFQSDQLMEKILGAAEKPGMSAVQISYSANIILALHYENYGRLAEVFIDNPKSLTALINHIRSAKVTMLIPKLAVNLRGSYDFPFEIDQVYKRSMFALFNSKVYETLTDLFCGAAKKRRYTANDAQIMDNASSTLGELAGRVLITPTAADRGFAFSESSRLYAKARAALDVYDRPAPIECVLAAGLREIGTGRDDDCLAINCALKTLRQVMSYHTKGRRCSHSIVTTLAMADKKNFTGMLSSYLVDIAGLLHGDKPVGMLTKLLASEVIMHCFVLYQTLTPQLIQLKAHSWLVKCINCAQGEIFARLVCHAFRASVAARNQDAISAWLQCKTWVDLLARSTSVETDDSKERSMRTIVRTCIPEFKAYLLNPNRTAEDKKVIMSMDPVFLKSIATCTGEDIDKGAAKATGLERGSRLYKTSSMKQKTHKAGMSERQQEAAYNYGAMSTIDLNNEEPMAMVEDLVGGVGGEAVAKASSWLTDFFTGGSEFDHQGSSASTQRSESDQVFMRNRSTRFALSMGRSDSDSGRAPRKQGGFLQLSRAASDSERSVLAELSGDKKQPTNPKDKPRSRFRFGK